ncbi:c-type cytochrome biogenesis protein CcmI [Jiella sp. MQZ9-1]|uniref:C-type cytochrome biogenesis protein CcmI n=1 Tax=Jiella flava TaxID=2816857 RepID=A0A939FYG4_9HYPH|nr:c-type cytochrome biogenesis protein CcmI [Jiella flava]MBO0661847.1 c-type cytochrome biogenesis protein CcmI [Jiella flava]MCD2470487.1 c-type cytochrome biogenesis protein CcmI [Jiella flava]
MMFWIVAAAMTAVVTLALVWPLLRGRNFERDVAADHDVEVYAAQLSELKGDLERGAIAESEAASARAEVGRRLLRASAKARTDRSGGGLERPLVLAAVGLVAVIVPALSFSLYEQVGDPDTPDQPLAFRTPPKDETPSFDLATLVKQAEARLKSDPNDAGGWDVLAPIYLRMNRPKDAVVAYRKAIDLAGPSPKRLGGLGEALTETADGDVTNEAKRAFEQALKINPDYLPAKFFLALDASQKQRAADAEVRWSELIADSPKNAPWLQVAEAGLADARKRLGKPAPSGAPGAAGNGPDAAAVAAASQMSTGARQVMIEGMVAELAARLKHNPNDVEGWKRLIRSYAVLGKGDAAKAALQEAQKAFPADTEGGREIAAFAERQFSTPAAAATDGIGQAPGNPASNGPPVNGPDAATMAAAAQMSAGDRQSMIEGMVAKLAARLSENPNDLDGWKRLIRSYTVLGKTDQAEAAVRDAQKAFPANTDGGREIAAFAEQSGLLAGKDGGTSP